MDKILEDIEDRRPLICLSSDSESETVNPDVASTSTANIKSPPNVPSTSGEIRSTVIGFGSLPKPEDQGAVKIKKLLSDLQFSNPGENNKVGLALPPRRRGRPVKFTDEERDKRSATKNNEIKHDRDGRLIVDDNKFRLCDCLKVECNGCQWPCKKCGGRLCNPVYCQRNRRLLLLKVETQGVQNGSVINPHLEVYLPTKIGKYTF